MQDRIFYENIGALKKGVILPSCDVQKELKKMTPDDAKKAKRKWRKLRRRATRHVPTFYVQSKSMQNYEARAELSRLGKKIIEG